MPKEKGWIKLYRDIFDSEIMEKPPHFREVWLFLLLKANHKEGYVSGTKIERGQTITSYKEIIQALSWKGGKGSFEYTDNKIQSALRYLETSGMIIKGKSAKKILVTIVNYKDYQQKENEVIHDKSTDSPQSIHDESTNSPHHKQEVRSKKEIYIPDISQFENLIDEIIEENDAWIEGIEEDAREKLFRKFEIKKFKNGRGKPFNSPIGFKEYLRKTLISITRKTDRAKIYESDIKSNITDGLNN